MRTTGDMPQRAPKQVNRNGPVPDTVTVQGITDTYAGFGKRVGLQAHSFRIRLKKLGPDHPMILATRAEMDAWRRAQVVGKWKEKRESELGCTQEQHRKAKREGQNRRAYLRRRERAEAKKAVRSKLTMEQRDNFTDAVLGLASVGKDELVRRCKNGKGLWAFLVALARADEPTPEELEQMKNFQQGDECEVEDSAETITCEDALAGPKEPEPVESWS